MNEVQLARGVQLEVSRFALESIFRECDLYDRDETGGRLVGHYRIESGQLLIQLRSVIEPGPKARRTSSSFFQDGHYQTRVFRELEARDPSIEHLGNWHTHHVNGYPTLSQGDIATYRRIVNHELHNLDFFYALLVTQKRKGRFGVERYAIRHYLLFRGDDNVYQVDPADVHISSEIKARKTPTGTAKKQFTFKRRPKETTTAIRANDQSVLKTMYPSLMPHLSKQSKTLIWKGTLPLVDGTQVFLKIMELESDGELNYFPYVTPVSQEATTLRNTPFDSASEAVRTVEQLLNQAIYKSASSQTEL